MNDRQADLHYAFQFGQDAVRGHFEEVQAEFSRKFAGDSEAQAEFAKGVIHQRARQI